VVAKNAAAFKIDYPNFSGLLFTSAINLPNTSASLAVRDGEQNNLDLVSYSSDRGAGGDGNSLNRSGTSWTAGSPTPGVANSIGVASPETVLPASLAVTAISNTVVDTPYVDRQTKAFTISVSKERNGVINSPVYFMASTDPDLYQEQARFTWSFGDGSVGAGQSAQHSYLLPGKYVATVRATAAPGFSVASIGVNISDFPIEFGEFATGIDGYITLINRSGGDMYLNGMSLTMGSQIYNFPIDFVLASGELKLPARNTGLALYAGKKIEIRDSNGRVILAKEVGQTSLPQLQIAVASTALPLKQELPINKAQITKVTPVIPSVASQSVAPVLVIERRSNFLTNLLALPRKAIGSIIGIF
jgi:hypothetical protein